MATFDIQFPFLVRQGLKVAVPLNRVINDDLRFDHNPPGWGTKPDPLQILRIASRERDGQGEVRVRFERGNDVTVRLFNLMTLYGSDQRVDRTEDWVVYEAKARYYLLNEVRARRSSQKVEHVFTVEELSRLRAAPAGWDKPWVYGVGHITGSVGVYWDAVADDGFISTDPGCNQDDRYWLVDTIPYQVLVEGDLERAMGYARYKLAVQRETP